MKYLVQLDLSDNKLEGEIELPNSPFNLQFVDVSRNQIKALLDLSHHRFLTKLCVDSISALNLDNQIEDLKGVMGCLNLRVISFANNKVKSIECLSGLPLIEINAVPILLTLAKQ